MKAAGDIVGVIVAGFLLYLLVSGNALAWIQAA